MTDAGPRWRDRRAGRGHGVATAGIEATVFEAYGRTADGISGGMTRAPNGMRAVELLDLVKCQRSEKAFRRGESGLQGTSCGSR